MNDPKDPKSRDDPSRSQPGSKSNDVPATPADESKRSGRVSFDSRGNSVWEWQLETGVYSRDVNTQKLKKLDLGDLSIAETAIQKGPLASGKDAQSTAGGGFNPYDNASRPKQEGFNPYDNARSLSNKFTPKQEQSQERAPRSLDDLRRLSEAIKLKRKLEGK
jgi:hypothetical protein